MRRYAVEVGGRTHTIDVEEITAERFRVRVGGHEFELKLSHAEDVVSYRPPALERLPPVPATAPPPLPPPPAPAAPAGTPAAGAADLRAPMPGTVVSVEVQPGAQVRRGDTLVKLEAMKMVNQVRAHHDGTVARVNVSPGQTVAYGEVLVTFARDDS